MTLPLTVDTLRAAYDFLDSTPPFSRWNLPDGEDVEFKVTRSRAYCGRHTYPIPGAKKHLIEISAALCGHTVTMLGTMAHEMIHVHEGHSRVGRSDVAHSSAFKRYAAQVCKAHGFDPKSF